MQSLNLVQKIIIWAPPVLLAITLHEVAHGWTARLLGDRTAEMLGRLSLNPIRHVDPLGTVVVPTMGLLIGGFLFGWAKPVPVAMRNLRHPRRDMAVVAIAGPASNLLMGLAWAVIGSIGYSVGGGSVGTFMLLMGVAGVLINLILAVINMIPILPLDGGRVLNGFLPPSASDSFERIEPYGLWIAFGLLISGVLSPVVWPIIGWVFNLLIALVGLPPDAVQMAFSSLLGR